MNKRKKQTIWVISILIILLLVGVGFVFQSQIREQFWIWKLRSSDDQVQDEALLQLGKLRCLRAVPDMVEVLSRRIEGKPFTLAKINSILTLIYFQDRSSGSPGHKMNFKCFSRFVEMKDPALLNQFTVILKETSATKKAVVLCVLNATKKEVKLHLPEIGFIENMHETDDIFFR